MSLSNIIKIIDGKKSKANLRSGQHCHSIIEGTEQVNPSLLSFKRGRRFSYSINTEETGKIANGESCTIHIQDPHSDDLVNFRIFYKATCPSNNHIKLVQSLGSGGDPEQELNTMITAVIQEFLWDKTDDLFTHFTQTKTAVLKHVIKFITSSTGLKFQANLVIDFEGELKTITVNETIDVRFSDSHETQKLVVRADFDVDSDRSIKAIIALPENHNIRNRVVGHVKDFFRHNVPAQLYVQEFRGSDIHEKLEKSLQKEFYAEGRKVRNLELSIRKSLLPAAELKLPLKASVKPLEREKPIPIKSEVILSLTDLAIFTASQVVDIEKWAEKTFDEILQSVCFEKKYVDYLQIWEEIERAIEHKMQEKAALIGYDVKQIISNPVLDENIYKNRFQHTFPLTGLPLNSSSNYKIDLNVFADFSLEKWGEPPLESKLNAGINLHDNIKIDLTDALSKLLVEVTENDFYLKYMVPNDEGITTEKRLIVAVEQRLTDDYNASVFGIRINPIITLDAQKVRDLLNKPHQGLCFKVDPYNTENSTGETISFRVDWIIKDVDHDSWDKVIRDFCNEETIGEAIKHSLIGGFNNVEDRALLFEKLSENIKLLELANKFAVKQIQSQYGLIIELSNLSRKKTENQFKAADHISTLVGYGIDEQNKIIEHEKDLLDKVREAEIKADDAHYATIEARRKEILRLQEISSEERTLEQQEDLERLVKDDANIQPRSGRTKHIAKISNIDTPNKTKPESREQIYEESLQVLEENIKDKVSKLPTKIENDKGNIIDADVTGNDPSTN